MDLIISSQYNASKFLASNCSFFFRIFSCCLQGHAGYTDGARLLSPLTKHS